jgi:2-methylcitrate dehydratase PrpD
MNIRATPETIDFDELKGISRRFCEAAGAIRYEDIPDDVIRTVKLFVIDTLGVIGGAAHAPGIPEIGARFARWEKDGSATNLITKKRLSPPHAALVNGAAAHGLDFDDMHDPARIHSFCVVLPALLAAAEDIGNVDGKKFLLALTVAAEMHARLGFACYNSLGKGWHPTMTLGVLAASLGIGRLLDQDAETLLNTFGLASHQACGSAQSMLDGVLSKRLGAGFAARGAVTAAFLANDGITGPFQPLEGNAGLFKLQERGEVRPDELLDGMGKDWRTRGYSFKPYPCCRCNHSSISLAIRLRDQGLKPDDVESLEIRLPQVNYQTVGQPYDATRDSIVHAQFNAAYSFARALTDGRVDLRTYTRPNIGDADVAALAARIVVKADPNEPATAMGPSHVLVTKKDGSTTEIREIMTPGSPESPMSEEEVFAKFRLCMEFGLGLGADRVEPLIQTVLRLEELGDVRELVALVPSAEL